MPPSIDWAIVVGIADYPDLGNLKSPENDARAFHAWVTSPSGGAVPPDRARLILSSQFPQPSPPGLRPPTIREVENELIGLRALAEENRRKGQGLQVGRRLYLYFSGHGCAPRFEEAAILMANATRQMVYHLAGVPSADWFFRSGSFSEIVLLMDCCREPYERVHTYVPPWVDLTQPDVMDQSQRFYGLAAPWSRLARERVMPDQTSRGVFTLALLAGLQGAAYDSTTEYTDSVTNKRMAHVTSSSLKNFMYNYLPEFLSPADRNDPQVAKQPDIPHPRDPNSKMVFATVEVDRYPVTIRVPPGTVGNLRITTLREDGTEEVLEDRPATPPEMKVDLPRNNYSAQVVGVGMSRMFRVKPIKSEGANVVAL
ncbi:MAG TPA: hypothetical protein VKE40_17785 [Gemmataceae bacterium]|nr:hypothetical protein [Gemmataceae bacterium]